MAVFRIERTRDYTVMSNHHLRDKALSLKSKGLLSMMLSLPEDWNYTTRGLAKICKEGVDAIGGALRELEAMCQKYRCYLPPFCHFTPEEWETKGHEYDEVRDCCLGWDITDYGQGNFDKIGFCLLYTSPSPRDRG